jgi:hypothetical protein
VRRSRFLKNCRATEEEEEEEDVGDRGMNGRGNKWTPMKTGHTTESHIEEQLLKMGLTTLVIPQTQKHIAFL